MRRLRRAQRAEPDVPTPMTHAGGRAGGERRGLCTGRRRGGCSSSVSDNERAAANLYADQNHGQALKDPEYGLHDSYAGKYSQTRRRDDNISLSARPARLRNALSAGTYRDEVVGVERNMRTSPEERQGGQQSRAGGRADGQPIGVCCKPRRKNLR